MKLWRVTTIERARVGADPKHDRLRIDAEPFDGGPLDDGPLIALGSVIACDMGLPIGGADMTVTTIVLSDEDSPEASP